MIPLNLVQKSAQPSYSIRYFQHDHRYGGISGSSINQYSMYHSTVAHATDSRKYCIEILKSHMKIEVFVITTYIIYGTNTMLTELQLSWILIRKYLKIVY